MLLSHCRAIPHTHTHTHTHKLLSANPQIRLHKYDTEQRSGEEGEDEGEDEYEHKDASPVAAMLQAKTQEQNDTNPLMWWKQHEQQFPRLARMIRQYLDVPARLVA